MSLPLLIRQIFADLIINGPHQNFRFRSDPNGRFHLKNEFEITSSVSSTTDFKIGDVNCNAFVLRYLGNANYSKNYLGLYSVVNDVISANPIFTVNQATGDFTFVSKAYFTKDDGTTALIGTGGSSSGITQTQLDEVVQLSQLTAALTSYVTNTSLTSTLNNYVSSSVFNTYVNTQSSNTNAYDSSLYSQINTIGTRINAYFKNIAYKCRYIYTNTTLFEDYVSFRIPTEVGYGTSYSFTDSNNYEWSFRERNSNTSIALLQFKTTAGVKSIVVPIKMQASGWVPSAAADLTTKGTVDAAINATVPIGTIQLFVKHTKSGLQLPTGYLQCNGGTINSLTYPDLFKAIGTRTLPNLTASAPRGTTYIIKAVKTLI